MPRACTICHHPEVDHIAFALREGVPLRQIAGAYGVALTTLSRHKQHVGTGCGTEPVHAEQPVVTRPAVSREAIEDLRRQAAFVRAQVAQLGRAQRSYHEYSGDTLVVAMAYMIANMVETLWPAEGR